MRGKIKEKISKNLLRTYLVLFILFLYLPMFAMFVLSFQGQFGGMSLPMNGVSLYWWKTILLDTKVIGAFGRSFVLGLMVMIVNAILSLMLGMAFRRQFRWSNTIFYTVIAGLMTPGILVSLGLLSFLKVFHIPAHWYTTAFGVHIIWVLPFGFLIMLAVFNRFDKEIEAAASDLGASDRQVFKEVTLPVVSIGILAAGLFGFTLSYDEFARTLLVSGIHNTLPLEIHSRMSTTLKPVVYVLGTASTVVSFIFVGIFILLSQIVAKRRMKRQITAP